MLVPDLSGKNGIRGSGRETQFLLIKAKVWDLLVPSKSSLIGSPKLA
jgi:hypothetical protein